MPDNKFWVSHRFMSPEVRDLAIKECGDCRFFVTIQGAWERRLGCVADVWKYRTPSVRVPATIHVMELVKSEGKEGLDKILEKSDPGAHACERWLPKQRK